MTRTWFITGASAGGIGEGIARAVLSRGDNAVITARSLDKLEGIAKDYPETALPIAMDITKIEDIEKAVAEATERFGGVDMLVNNAGYAYRSSIEEAEDEGMMRMYNTNLFGPVHLIQKLLPQMREKGKGAIINVSSIAAARTGAASGFYASSKAALELMSEGLAAEVKPLGIKVMIVEPGSFRTHFYDSSLKGSKMTIDAYKETAWTRSVENTHNPENQPGDPMKTGDVIIDTIDRDDAPMRLLLGSDAVRIVSGTYEARLKEIETWAETSKKTDF